MNIKEFLKPGILKVLIFLLIAVLFLYFVKEDACGVSIFFAFCYNAYGFPLPYLVAGNIESALGHIKTLPLGDNFAKYGNFLFNPAALLWDLALIYLLSCFMFMLFKNMKLKS